MTLVTGFQREGRWLDLVNVSIYRDRSASSAQMFASHQPTTWLDASATGTSDKVRVPESSKNSLFSTRLHYRFYIFAMGPHKTLHIHL